MIRVNFEKCSGCRRCEVNCSFFHSGRVGRNLARIKVVKIEDQGIDFPVVCPACQERYCTKCPESAIEIGPKGQVVVSPTLCSACGACEALCPVGAIELYDEIPRVCDLCGGDPKCVTACTLGAISYEEEAFDAISLKEFKKQAKGLSPEDKRVRFAFAAFKKLRDQWISARRG
jgi:carbon-monoxide dehydrogenase iron sulfur subunit